MSGYLIVTAGGHLDDGVLLQLLDGDPLAPGGADAHLANCAACADRLGMLRRAANLLRASLPDVAMPPIDLRVASRGHRWMMSLPLAAAATLVVLATAAAATPPLRNWILRRLSGSPAPSAPATAPPPAAPTPRSAGIIASFTPTDTALLIRVDRHQAAGALDLRATTGRQISAQALGTASDELIVLPGQLRIANAATSRADYRVTLPASVRVVHVMIDGVERAAVRVGPSLHRRVELRRRIP